MGDLKSCLQGHSEEDLSFGLKLPFFQTQAKRLLLLVNAQVFSVPDEAPGTPRWGQECCFESYGLDRRSPGTSLSREKPQSVGKKPRALPTSGYGWGRRLLQRQEGSQRRQAQMWIPFLLRTSVRPILVPALGSTEHLEGLGASTVKATLARHNHRDTSTPKSWVSGGHACTHSSFQVALPGAGTAGGVLTPCLACGLILCPTSPLSSTGHRAASSSSSHDLRRIIHSLRCSLGRRLPPSWPCSPPSLPASPAFAPGSCSTAPYRKGLRGSPHPVEGDRFLFH